MTYDNKHCAGCIYYGTSTETCDYILLEDSRRPCPPGSGCTVRRTKRRRRVRKPKWDTELGRLLWLDGRKDGEIADEFGIPISTVTAYRKRHWEKGSQQPEKKEVPKEEETVEEINVQTAPPMEVVRSENVYDILEKATANMKGIDAICTADAILSLWNWETREDLLRAKNAVEHLLRKSGV